MVTSKAVVVSRAEAEGAKSGYRNGIETRTYELPELQQNQVLVRIYAAGFNHREVGDCRFFHSCDAELSELNQAGI